MLYQNEPQAQPIIGSKSNLQVISEHSIDSIDKSTIYQFAIDTSSTL